MVNQADRVLGSRSSPKKLTRLFLASCPDLLVLLNLPQAFASMI